MHEHLSLLKTKNNGFRNGDFLEVHLQVLDHKLKVLNLAHDLTLILNGFFGSLDMRDVFVSFIEIILDELDDILAIHFRSGLRVKEILFEILLSDFLLTLAGIVKIHFNNVLHINVRSLIPSHKTANLNFTQPLLNC